MQLESIDAVDNKIGMLASLASALLGILAAVLALKANGLGATEIVVLVLSVLAYLYVGGLSVRAYFCQSWKSGPKLDQVWKMLWTDADDELVKWRVANALWASHDANATPLKVKTEALPRILAGVVTQSLLLTLVLALVAEGS